MKKSKVDPKVDPEDVLKDAEEILKVIEELDNINLKDIGSFGDKLKKLEKTVSKKYKNYLEESEDDLDSEG